MKGFVIEIGLIGLIFTVGSIIFIMIPLIFTKIHLVEIVDLKYKYDNAQLALLSVMSITHEDGLDQQTKAASEILGEYVSMPSSRGSMDIGFIKTALDRMVENGIMECYELTSASVGKLFENTANCDPDASTAKMVIPIPFDGQIASDEITLVMN